MTYFEEIGGEIAVSAIIDEFVERVCADTMIGYLFRGVNRARLKRMEYEHAANLLGADIPYTGRDLREAHRRHAIMGGQFGRRRQILKQTLERHHVKPELIGVWLAHQDALRDQVTADEIGVCSQPGTPARETGTGDPAREQDDDGQAPGHTGGDR